MSDRNLNVRVDKAVFDMMLKLMTVEELRRFRQLNSHVYSDALDYTKIEIEERNK